MSRFFIRPTQIDDYAVARGSDDDADFSDAFCEFLQRSVATVNAAELLLLLRANRATGVTASDAVTRLGHSATLSHGEAARYLDVFQQRGLVVRAEHGLARYQPESPVLDAHVEALAKLYNERPVTLIRVIYALQDKKIKTFADAFRIWKG